MYLSGKQINRLVNEQLYVNISTSYSFLYKRVEEMSTKTSIYYTELTFKEWYIFIAATKNGLCYVSADPNGKIKYEKWLEITFEDFKSEKNENVLEIYTEQFIDYMEGKRINFSLPLDLYGSRFQKETWKVLVKIPYGETKTYSDIANQIGKPSAVRAVASAIGKNPALILVPCHRVIRKNGELSGFRDGIEIKKKLLALESKRKRSLLNS